MAFWLNKNIHLISPMAALGFIGLLKRRLWLSRNTWNRKVFQSCCPLPTKHGFNWLFLEWVHKYHTYLLFKWEKVNLTTPLIGAPPHTGWGTTPSSYLFPFSMIDSFRCVPVCSSVDRCNLENGSVPIPPWLIRTLDRCVLCIPDICTSNRCVLISLMGLLRLSLHRGNGSCLHSGCLYPFRSCCVLPLVPFP